MSTCISYEGRDLGHLKIDGHGKTVFVAEDMKSLVTLLGLGPSEGVVLEGNERKTFAEFERDDFDKVSIIYPSLEDYIKRDIPLSD